MADDHRDKAIAVAVVEHRDLVRTGIVNILTDAGHHVVLAVRSGGELLSALRDGAQVRVVLLEMELPGMSGFTVLDRLREKFPQVRVIAMAHEPTDELVRRAMRQEASTVICTGLCAAELCKAVHDVALTKHHYSALLRRQIESGWKLRDNTAQDEAPKRRKGGPCPRELEYWTIHCRMKNPTVRRIAERMGATYNTARTWHRRLCKKLGVRGSLELLRAGYEAGLVQLE